ncbi:hypothetical protein NC653_028485 [Populus alba x Populus x berolinensis]|uniref:Uncharacterized protein n=1 Tax=Populus alba x Populus x berolinensis TaxID=444605 RepID=A0AAD6Q299_9ROSI|nr:hypothetical protein NC653_028485 [Populus alba x Populus x berolinensis]
MDFGTGSVSGRAAANQMEWTVNNAFKTYKAVACGVGYGSSQINDGGGTHPKCRSSRYWAGIFRKGELPWQFGEAPE